MVKLSKILLGCTASTLLVVTSVAASETPLTGTALYLQADTVVNVALEPMNGAETSGVAMFQEAEEGQTALDLEVVGLEADDALLAMIVTGTCEEPGEVRASLGLIETDQEGTARAGFALDDPIENVLAVPSTIRLQPQGPEAEVLLCGQISPSLVEELPETLPAQTPVPDPIPAEDTETETDDADPVEDEAADETTENEPADSADES